jgi:hypothetical protein
MNIKNYLPIQHPKDFYLYFLSLLYKILVLMCNAVYIVCGKYIFSMDQDNL